jgi:acyl-CoA thioesterase
MKRDLREMCERFNSAPYYHLLGLSAASDAPGRAVVTLPFDEKLTQLYGGVHGGALMTLADAAISIAVTSVLDSEERVATTEINMHFLEPAGRDGLVATGEITRRGKRICFGRCEIHSGERLVAQAQGICAVFSLRAEDRRLETED